MRIDVDTLLTGPGLPITLYQVGSWTAMLSPKNGDDRLGQLVGVGTVGKNGDVAGLVIYLVTVDLPNPIVADGISQGVFDAPHVIDVKRVG
jgi:hypothetical protein